MRAAEHWKDFEVLDTSGGEKLERWGDQLLVRPDPQAIWETPHANRGWKNAQGRYHRSSTGGGHWDKEKLPEQWQMRYRDLTFQCKPMNFKHTGLFPEQAVNWDFAREKIEQAGRPIRVLNLFAYTGAASVACAKSGASVCHVDAALGEGEREGQRSGRRADPLDRGRLREVRRARDPPRQDLRRHHHGPAELRPRPGRRGLEAGG